jgi:hypothetical protein
VFTFLIDLESWAASHETHLAIYLHAIAMKRRYGNRSGILPHLEQATGKGPVPYFGDQ